QRAEVASPCLEDLPVERARLLGSAPRTRFVGAPEQLERERVVLRGRGRRTRKEITETEADGHQRPQRGEERHGERRGLLGRRGRGSGRGRAAPWPSVPFLPPCVTVHS